MQAQQVAKDAAQWFETAQRSDDEESSYVRTKDGAPEWVTNLVYAAHDDGEFLPDDWRYSCISAAVDAIADTEDAEDLAHEFADGYVDVYTLRRFHWLASHIRRQFYVDDAQQEFGPSEDIAQAVGLGQYMEAAEVFASVYSSLEERGEEIGERLEELRDVLRSESMSYGELAELQDLAAYIEDGDVELLEAAGVPEFADEA